MMFSVFPSIVSMYVGYTAHLLTYEHILLVKGSLGQEEFHFYPFYGHFSIYFPFITLVFFKVKLSLLKLFQNVNCQCIDFG